MNRVVRQVAREQPPRAVAAASLADQPAASRVAAADRPVVAAWRKALARAVPASFQPVWWQAWCQAWFQCGSARPAALRSAWALNVAPGGSRGGPHDARRDAPAAAPDVPAAARARPSEVRPSARLWARRVARVPLAQQAEPQVVQRAARAVVGAVGRQRAAQRDAAVEPARLPVAAAGAVSARLEAPRARVRAWFRIVPAAALAPVAPCPRARRRAWRATKWSPTTANFYGACERVPSEE